MMKNLPNSSRLFVKLGRDEMGALQPGKASIITKLAEFVRSLLPLMGNPEKSIPIITSSSAVYPI
jgi:hypothetical protein